MSPLLIAGIALCCVATLVVAERLSLKIRRPSIVPIEEALERDRKLMRRDDDRDGEQESSE